MKKIFTEDKAYSSATSSLDKPKQVKIRADTIPVLSFP